MKNCVKLFGLVFVTLIVLSSCSEKGGTIEVTNDYNETAYIVVSKGVPSIDSLKNDRNQVKAGEKKVFSFDENGIYLVFALPLSLSTKPDLPDADSVTLFFGESKKITVGE